MFSPLFGATWLGLALALAVGPAPESTDDDRDDERPRARVSLREGVGVDSADGRFGVGFGFLGWVLHEAVVGPAPSRGFVLSKVRPVLTSHLWGETLQLFMQPELAGSPALLDARALVQIHPAFGFMLGQYRPWYTRGFRVGLPFQTVLDRGVVLDSFRIDRDLGLTILGAPFDGRLEYYFGILNGDGPNPGPNVDTQLLYTGRVVVSPLGPMPYEHTRYLTETDPRLSIGLNAYTNVVADSETVTDPITGETTEVELEDQRVFGLAGDFAASVSIVGIEAEGFWRRSLRPDRTDTYAWGTYGQVSVLTVPERMDVSMRVGALQREDDPDPFMPISPALGVYVAGNHAKVQFRYTCEIVPGDDACTTHAMVGLAQLFF